MVFNKSNENKNSNKDTKSRSAAKNKHPTIGQCRKAAGGSPTRGEVFQKLCHYCSNPPFEIDGKMYSAPTTDMLRNELGLGRSTIQKRIKELRELGLIEVLNQRYRRSDRRYVRILIDPRESDGQTKYEKPGFTGLSVDGEPAKEETVTPSKIETVQYKNKTKKKYQKKEASSQEVACQPKNSTNSGEVADDSKYVWKPGGIQIKNRLSGNDSPSQAISPKAVEPVQPTPPRPASDAPLSLGKAPADREAQKAASSFANRIVVHLQKKRGVDHASLSVWYQRAFDRRVREYMRKVRE